MRTSSVRRALLVFIAGSFSLPVPAQIGGGSIVGSITDPSGAAIAGARVAVTNLGTNEAREAITNTSGYYEFPLLNAGTYRLEATAAGFQTAAASECLLNVGTRPRIDLSSNSARSQRPSKWWPPHRS